MISASGLTRHLANHVQPSVRQYLEVQQNMEALEKATGKKLSLPRVFVNTILSKALRLIDGISDDDLKAVSTEKLIREGTRAAQAALNIEKAEKLLETVKVETVKAAAEGMEKRGISKATIEMIEKEILGL